MRQEETSQIQRRTGLSIHVLTASGALAALFALQSAVDGHIRASMLWLIVCQVLDGIDGPIARKFDVSVHAPRIDGHVLDLVIDYVACVVVPTMLLVRLNLVNPHLTMVVAGIVLMSSALWFARIDQETDDLWFNGFPAMWNIIIPTFVLLDTSQTAAAIICILLSAAQLTTIKFPHLVRVQAMRRPTYVITTIYFAAFIFLTSEYPNESEALKQIILVCPLYLLFIVTWRTWFPNTKIRGVSILAPTNGDVHRR